MKNIFLFAVSVLLASSVTAQVSQNAVNFDGSDDYIQTTYPGISGSAARTVEAWIKTTANANPSASGTQKTILDWGSFTTGGRFTFNILWGNALRLEVGGSGFSGKIAVNDGNWHHVAGVFDPNATNKYSLYVDGVLDTAGNIATTLNTGTGVNMMIGRRVDGANVFDGTIDEVRVWNYAKSLSGLDSFKNVEICPNHAGLVAYYRLNNGTANGNNSGVTSATDKSASGNTGTLTNFGLSGSTSNWVNGANITLAPDTLVTKDTTVCGGFVSPQGNQTIFTGSVTDVFTASTGCDSLVKYNVTVNSNTFNFASVTACDSFRTPKGVLKTSSAVYNERFTGVNGCDSTVQTTLTINYTKRITISPAVCNSYTSPSGKMWNLSGNYKDTVVSRGGCDSILTISLTIKNKTYQTKYDTACSFYQGPRGNLYTTSGTYKDTVTNAAGCDSIITTHLVINHTSDTSFSPVACDSFTSHNGDSTWYTNGNYMQKFSNLAGCDSTVKYSVTIKNSTKATLQYNLCGPFKSPKGNTINATGIYHEVLTNTIGCDSALTLNVTITQNNPIVTKNEDSLETSVSGVSYQWLYCDFSNSPVAGAKAQKFRPKKSGNYTVEVIQNNCRDTATCINYPRTASISDLESSTCFVSPNPANHTFVLHTAAIYSSYRVTNSLGAIIEEGECTIEKSIDTRSWNPGVYFVTVVGAEDKSTIPVVISH